ncbi:putative S-adenosyl-L-methionine-dependent methyltransferase [Mycolicibacterium litorale]|uniref:S-adenosyl-L-methionine-dependent methyltransferase n=1 Tax=Mycolicibacterium litorale TaxID=758802 RepID=A0A6S6P351_9MYCO|nr:SAM-dependent methyltransferase [Mycolicibacterium litorale]BCI50808.1 putative S-adenosyl-L-methionine-dependent methyltransferase [Mycolicibacterium litorale]
MRKQGAGASIATRVGPEVLSAAAVASVTGCDDPLAAVLLGPAKVTEVLQRSAELIDQVPALAAAHHQIADYHAVRSRFFDAYLADAVASGIRQCVVLAAGLDTRAFRLRWPDGMTVFEIDQPTVLRYKENALTAHGARPAADWRPVGVEADAPWPTRLWEAGFNHNVPTAWLAEGLLPLPDAAQDAVITEIDQLSAAGSLLAFDDVLGPCPGRSDAPGWLTAQGWWTDVVEARHLPELAGRRGDAQAYTAKAVLVTAEKVA